MGIRCLPEFLNMEDSCDINSNNDKERIKYFISISLFFFFRKLLFLVYSITIFIKTFFLLNFFFIGLFLNKNSERKKYVYLCIYVLFGATFFLRTKINCAKEQILEI